MLSYIDSIIKIWKLSISRLRDGIWIERTLWNKTLEAVMISKEMIKKEIDNIPEERLHELHLIIKEFTTYKNAPTKGNLMAKLRQVKIHGPKDFSKNIDTYLSGEISGG